MALPDMMPIFLFTDFGSSDLYVGQVRTAVLAHAPEAAVIDLLHDAPAFDIRAGAHLLAALAARTPEDSVIYAVVDPGVGGGREPIAVRADRRWYVGPDNGLLSVVAARAREVAAFPITWRPAFLSASFHGRDLFAPVAAMIARGQTDMLGTARELAVRFGGGDLAEIIYIDHYGNAMTGLRGVAAGARLVVGGHRFDHARVFSAVEEGAAFWYENSIGLAEIAANQTNAARRFELLIGDAVGVEA